MTVTDQNPYESIPSLPKSGESLTRQKNLTQQKPAGLTVVPVFCLILGLLGSLITLAGLVMLAFQSFNGGPASMPTAGPPGMAQYQADIEEFQQHQFVPNLFFNGCGLIVGGLLVVGAIGVFGLKEWGRNVLRNALLLAVAFVALRGVYTAWVQYRTMGMLAEALAPSSGSAASFEVGLQVGVIAVIAIGLIWGVALAGFYLWSRSYLNKPSVVAFFNAAN